MGNIQTKNPSNATNEIDNAILKLEEQLNENLALVEENEREADRLSTLAVNALSSGRNTLAAQFQRRKKELDKHIASISGINHTLDQHRLSLCTRRITNKTMSVMKATANTLSKNLPDLERVDDMMLNTCEDQDNVTDLLGALSIVSETDEELINEIKNSHPSKKETKEPPTHVSLNDDELFMAQLESEIDNFTQKSLNFPPVPSHEPTENKNNPPPYKQEALIV